MAAQGTVLEREWKSGRGYALRFVAYGTRRYLTLGLQADGWTRAKAEAELANVMADVRRGLWIPAERTATPAELAEPKTAPGFHAFASDWLASRHGEVAPRSLEFFEWALVQHLLPYFATWQLPDITIEAVDNYRRHKTQQAELRRDAITRGSPMTDENGRTIRPLSPTSINKTLDVLQAVLALAVEYGHLTTNPASGRRRRLKPTARRPIHLDTVAHIQAVLDAASDLDQRPGRRVHDRRAHVATLIFAGPRAGEDAALRWSDIDLTNGRIHIGRSKTQAGLREITLLPILKAELTTHRQRSEDRGPHDFVFPTTAGTQRDKDNIRNRVLAPILTRADQLLTDRGQPPLPAGVTPHKLRHTFASILVACGEDPASVMAQLGHTDPQFTLRIYTHLMRRDPEERKRLRDLVGLAAVG